MPHLVGIVGYAQVGKDSTAAVFEELGFERKAFADTLRELAEYLDPILNVTGLRYSEAIRMMGYEEAKRLMGGFREFLKDLGNGCRKYLGHDIWIRAVIDDVTSVRPVVISDVRFLNEARAIRDKGQELDVPTLIVRVDRPGIGPESDFEREIAHITPDVVIHNDGTLDDLRSTVLDVCGDYMLDRASTTAARHIKQRRLW